METPLFTFVFYRHLENDTKVLHKSLMETRLMPCIYQFVFEYLAINLKYMLFYTYNQLLYSQWL